MGAHTASGMRSGKRAVGSGSLTGKSLAGSPRIPPPVCGSSRGRSSRTRSRARRNLASGTRRDRAHGRTGSGRAGRAEDPWHAWQAACRRRGKGGLAGALPGWVTPRSGAAVMVSGSLGSLPGRGPHSSWRAFSVGLTRSAGPAGSGRMPEAMPCWRRSFRAARSSMFRLRRRLARIAASTRF